MSNNVIETKSFDFAIRIVRLCQYITKRKREYVMSNQLLKCGTSIGANVSEAQKAQSLADFNAKMNIALKEANETDYWLRLLRETEYLSEKEYESICADIKEIVAILVSICRKTNKK